jgi:hypothetical protein
MQALLAGAVTPCLCSPKKAAAVIASRLEYEKFIQSLQEAREAIDKKKEIRAAKVRPPLLSLTRRFCSRRWVRYMHVQKHLTRHSWQHS